MSGNVLQINFRFNVTAPEYAELAASLAPAFAEVPGLLWKVWIMNQDEREAGGIYYFESGDSLQQFVSSQLAADVRNHPAVMEFSAKTFDVMDDVTAVTRGPVTEVLTV